MEMSDQLTAAPQIPCKNGMDFVTVVSVGTEETLLETKDEEVPDSNLNPNLQLENDPNNSAYVTVLKIGHSNNSPKEIIEEVLVYRLPGERLGFGLKFEGGTKAAEFVKRLFIQSCAPDSPASMVHCSWGKLTEGDEVLNIDSLPVTSMTRIDCVRCLKDSNVVIKLLVRHFNTKSSEDVEDSNDSSARVTEALPHVIGAEKKRTPPPPPPVPPRKIPRKMLKESINIAINVNPVAETDSSPLHHTNETVVNGHRGSRFHSPRSSGKFAHSRQSPEVSRHVYRDRRLSDGSVGPPDAEVYLDLFSQESGCSLSESDDTGSSISTIIDRFSSFPTTTNSSLAGSLPSTPTSIQKQLDISHILNPFDNNDLDAISNDNYLFSKLVSSENGTDELETSISLKNTDEMSNEKLIKDSEAVNEEGTPLQPPTSFQDAPLSYGNEDVGVVEASLKTSVREDITKYNHQKIAEIADENGNCLKELNFAKLTPKVEQIVKVNKTEKRRRPPPPPPPCEKPKSISTENKDEVDGVNIVDLPRLVHFVPKYSKTSENQCEEESSEALEAVKLFLENEIRYSELSLSREKGKLVENGHCINLDSADTDSEIYNSELYNLTWSISPQLATIGEDDEEGWQEMYFHKSPSTSTPIVIIENADLERLESENHKMFERSGTPDGDGNILTDDGEKSSEDKNSLQTENSLSLDSSTDICEVMEAPPSSSRQPPDGDEFPDYHETPITPKPLKMEEPSNKLPHSWINNNLWKTNSSSILFRDQQSSCSVRDKIAIFSNASTQPNDLTNLKKICKSTDDIFSTLEKERLTKDKTFPKDNIPLNKVKRSASALCKTMTDHTIQNKEKMNKTLNSNVIEESSKTRSSLDLPFVTSRASFLSEEKVETERLLPQPRLHTRSQSLMDISTLEQTPIRKDRWNLLAEQRQRSLSKLKGLIIPEKVVEVDVPNVVDLPEIKSTDANSSTITTSSTTMPRASPESPIIPCQRNISIPSLTTPPWNCNNSSNIPKYSPAFKRKSLQLHNEIPKTDIYSNENCSRKSIAALTLSPATYEAETVLLKSTQKSFPVKPLLQPNTCDNQESKISGNLFDAPKSLESITSPTRSDCSFEYVNSFLDIKAGKQESTHKVSQLDTRIGLYALHKGKEDMGRSEDESDNDSAVSSSQSSYVSRTSPPTSPSHLHSNFTSQACSINECDSLAQLKCHSTGSQPHSQSGDNQNHRLLKPQSVEAINRKNILASAKCRSGRDLKIGSPLIQRKFEEEAAAAAAAAAATNSSLHANATEIEYNGTKCFRRCSTIYEKVNDVPVNSDSDIIQSEISVKEEDSLLADNKEDCGMQGWVRKENKQIIEQSKTEITENGIKSFPDEKSPIIHNKTKNETFSSRRNSKIEEKTISKDSLISDLTNNHERKVPIPKPSARDLRSTSVTDLRKSFEKLTPVQAPVPVPIANLNKNSPSSAIKNNQSQKNSPTSRRPSTEQQNVHLTDETKLELKESGYKDVAVIVLRPEIPGGSVGITLAGGADYENKEITVHKIRGESSAHRDGRLQKGDKIISINGKSVKNLTHTQLVALLKEPLPEVTLTVCKQAKVTTPETPSLRTTRQSTNLAPTKQKEKTPTSSKQATFLVSLVKDAAGLGLSLEGGQDSPLGNVPLLIKKVFKGGAAEKFGNLHVGDELLMINDTDVSSMSRFEAWSVLKKLSEGSTISLTLRR